MRNKIYYIVIFALCIFFTQEVFAKDPVWRIQIKENVILSNSKVYLKDIAIFVGDKDSKAWEELSNTLLWEESSPLGVVYSFGKMKLQKLLREKLQEKERFCLYPPTLRYQRGGYILTKDEIEKKVEDIFIPQLKKQYKADVDITDIIIPKAIFISNNSDTFRIDAKSLRSGRMPFILEIVSSTGNSLKRFQASAFVNVYVDAFCAIKDIRKWENMDMNTNIALCRKNSALVSGLIVQEKDIYNSQARVGIARGSILVHADLEKIPAIKKGSIIFLEYRNTSLSLRIEVEALKDGYIGDYIPVRNIQSKKTMTALVKENNKVLIMR